jgi:hypothetical protein
VKSFGNKQAKSKSSSGKSSVSSSSSETLSVHIVEDLEEVNVAHPDVKTQTPSHSRARENSASEISSSSEDLESEMMKLCYEIGNANGDMTDSSVDLTYQEEKELRHIIDKVKKMKKFSQSFPMIIQFSFFFFFQFFTRPKRKSSAKLTATSSIRNLISFTTNAMTLMKIETMRRRRLRW